MGKKLILNHEEAYEFAMIKQKESNLARCYLDKCKTDKLRKERVDKAREEVAMEIFEDIAKSSLYSKTKTNALTESIIVICDNFRKDIVEQLKAKYKVVE